MWKRSLLMFLWPPVSKQLRRALSTGLCSSGPVSVAPFIYTGSAQRPCSGESRWNKTSSIPHETPTFPPITPKQRSGSHSAISHCSAPALCNEEWERVRPYWRRRAMGQCWGDWSGEQVRLFDVFLQKESEAERFLASTFFAQSPFLSSHMLMN